MRASGHPGPGIRSTPSLLLIEPDPGRLENIALLLRASMFGVTALHSYVELLDLQGDASFEIALISDGFDPEALRKVTTCIRHRWPAARVVIIGGRWLELEDNLYDETFDHHFQPQKLIDVLRQWTDKSSGEA